MYYTINKWVILQYVFTKYILLKTSSVNNVQCTLVNNLVQREHD